MSDKKPQKSYADSWDRVETVVFTLFFVLLIVAVGIDLSGVWRPEPACEHLWHREVSTEATCTRDGVLTNSCVLCYEFYDEPLAATGHSYQTVDVAPTCTADGQKTITCLACGDSSTDVTAAALGHDYDNHVCRRCNDREPSEGLEFSRVGDGYEVLGVGSCRDAHIVIPSTYKGLPVTGIGDKAFSDCDFLTTITIPDSVTSIGVYAFWVCSSLTSVTIPDRVTSIGMYAFCRCDSLATVLIGNGVTSMGSCVFLDCGSLSDIYCKASSMPTGWHSWWLHDCSATVHWDYKG